MPYRAEDGRFHVEECELWSESWEHVEMVPDHAERSCSCWV